MITCKCGRIIEKPLPTYINGQEVWQYQCPDPTCNSVYPYTPTRKMGKETSTVLASRVSPSIEHATPIKVNAMTVNDRTRITGTERRKGFLARTLDKITSLKYDRFTPIAWFKRQAIVPEAEVPKASGYGYTQSPYISFFTKMWGVNRPDDMVKWRQMYRTVPVVKAAIDKTVATAVSKGFELKISKDNPDGEKIKKEIWDWINKQENFMELLMKIAHHMLVEGTMYFELVYEDLEVEEKYDPTFTAFPYVNENERSNLDSDPNTPWLGNVYTVSNPGGKYLEVRPKGKLLYMKPLDPLYMRVRVDSYGNIFGYLQFLSVPPVAFTPEKIACFRYMPKGWSYEWVYGVSKLQALVRTQEIIWQLENDLIAISHAMAKPPIIFRCGTPEQPYSEEALNAFIQATSTRGPGGDIYCRGDVTATPLPHPSSSIGPLIQYLEYHKEQRINVLGTPPQLLGMPEGSTRSTAEVNLDDWINTIKVLQECIADAIEEQVFRRILEEKFGPDVEVPKIIWNEVFKEDENAVVQRIVALKNSSIITVSEARAWLKEIGKDLLPLDKLPEEERAVLMPEMPPVGMEGLPPSSSPSPEPELEEKEKVMPTPSPDQPETTTKPVGDILDDTVPDLPEEQLEKELQSKLYHSSYYPPIEQHGHRRSEIEIAPSKWKNLPSPPPPIPSLSQSYLPTDGVKKEIRKTKILDI